MEAKEGAEEEAVEIVSEEQDDTKEDIVPLEEEMEQNESEIKVEAEREETDFMDAEDVENAGLEEAYWKERATSVPAAVAVVGAALLAVVVAAVLAT